MTITASDIKIYASERMADTPDGGGRRTSSVIADGDMGAIFPKISRAAAVRGRVELRKLYPAVDTDTLDVYAGAMQVLTEPPSNARVAVTMFSTGSDFDTRAGARDRIESYVIAGPESRMVLYGRQLAGQSAILVYQRLEAPVVDVGTVLCLSAETAGTVTGQQFVRVSDVAHEERVVTDSSGDFKVRAVTLSLTGPLRQEFAGPDAPSRSTSVTKPALVRETTVADASRYKSITRLAQDADAGDLAMRVQSVFTAIVPSTQRESPVSNLPPPGASALRRGRAAPLAEQRLMLQYINPGTPSWSIRLKRPALPGSVAITIRGFDMGTPCVYTDNGAGVLLAQASRHPWYPAEWPIDYTTGVVSASVSKLPAYGFWANAVFVPASVQSETQHTDAIPVTLASRGTVVVRTLRPVPAPGTLRLAYRAMSRWYELRDDGDGGLSGDTPAIGSGSIDYASGALVATLGALPDVGSSIVIARGVAVQYEAVTNNAAASAEIVVDLPNGPIAPDSYSVTWTSGGAACSAQDNASGALSGHCAGQVDYTTGRVRLVFAANVPDAGTNIVHSYNQLTPSGATPTVEQSTVNVGAPGAFSVPVSVAGSGSITARYRVTVRGQALDYAVRLIDNGSGSLITSGDKPDLLTEPPAGAPRVGMVCASGQVAGTINAATGAVALSGTLSFSSAIYIDAYYIAAGTFGTVASQIFSAAAVAGVYTYALRTGAASTTTARTHTVAAGAAAPLQLRLLTTDARPIAPGSVWVQIRPPATIVNETDYGTGGDIVDDGAGALVLRPNLLGAGTACGSINYATGIASLTTWPASGAALGLVVQSLTVSVGLAPTDQISFRTPGAPLRPASFLVQATATDGTLLTAVADQSGVLAATDVTGTVQQDMGVATVRFGRMVAAAGNEAQPWYDADMVEGGQIWRPKPVIPSSVRFSAVVLTSLPIDADLLGLDPVRLPADGRVPTIRAGDMLYIASTQTAVLPNPAVAGATYALGRTGLDFARVIDAAGAPVPPSQFTIDLAAGSIVMAGSLSLAGLTQPLRVKHRVGEWQQATDVQIDGQVSVSAPLSRAYAASDTSVSAALEAGDVVARVYGLFDQATWLGNWRDAPEGSGAAAQYNDVGFPVEVLNSGAVTERWRLNFTSSTTYQLVGESLGVIATGSTTVDLQPVNPVTGEPFFTLRAAGFGAGWAAGNQLRFNTESAGWPCWVVRTTLPGASTAGDAFDMMVVGDVD